MTPEAAGKQNRPLLTVSEASKFLGVSEATLRQWSDEGKLKAFVTPGGHRRYLESELRNFMGTHRRVQGIKDLVARIELTPSVEAEIAQTRFAEMSWYNKLGPEEKRKLAELGRRIHRVVIMYISKQGKHEECRDLAKAAAYDFGEYLARLGISLTDAIEAFLLHRSPLVNAATDLMKKRERLNERAAEAIPMVTQITDEVLLSLVEAYQKHHNTGPVTQGGNGR